MHFPDRPTYIREVRLCIVGTDLQIWQKFGGALSGQTYKQVRSSAVHCRDRPTNMTEVRRCMFGTDLQTWQKFGCALSGQTYILQKFGCALSWHPYKYYISSALHCQDRPTNMTGSALHCQDRPTNMREVRLCVVWTDLQIWQKFGCALSGQTYYHDRSSAVHCRDIPM